MVIVVPSIALGTVAFTLVCLFLFVYMSACVYTAASSGCWRGVNEPLQDVHEVKTKNVKLKLDPNCLEEIVITGDVEGCIKACRGEMECADRCAGEGSRIFFIVVRKEKSGVVESVVSGIKSILPFGGSGTHRSYMKLCSFMNKTIKCTPDTRTRELTLEIDRHSEPGNAVGTCIVNIKEGDNRARRLCREIG